MPTSTPTKDDPVRGLRTGRRLPARVLWLAAAALAAIAVIVLTNMPAPGTRQQAAAAPVSYRPLVGGGSDTTGPLMAALERDIPELSSLATLPRGSVTTRDPATQPDCTLPRPDTDVAAVDALVAQQASARQRGTAACLDFARSSVNGVQRPELAAAGLTFIPFGVDAVTFAQRADSPNPRTLTAAQLAGIFRCAAPDQEGYRPVLPAFGSGLRTAFLAAIGLQDSPTMATDNRCVTESQGAGSRSENTGQDLSDPKQIAPYSAAQYAAQVGQAAEDAHGTVVVGRIDGVAPLVPDTGGVAVGLVRRADSPNGRMTLDLLKSLYSCSAKGAVQVAYKPLLPGPGSPTRAAFLKALGLTDAPDYVATHTCVSQTVASGSPLPENAGQAITDARAIAPYAIDQYLAQATGAVPDRRGSTVLVGVDGLGSMIANAKSPTAHEVYTVVPTARLGESPLAQVFVGAGSALCGRTETIRRFGFAPTSHCGDTATHTTR